MRMVLLGPPGAGKGTQAESIASEYFIPLISTGAMFRSAIKAGTDAGKKAEKFMDKGELVSDDITNQIVKDRLAQPDCEKGFLLDGYPRSLPQAEFLNETLEEMGTALDMVIDIDVPDERLVERISGRRVCHDCGAVYHKLYNPVTNDKGVCDQCEGELYQRMDDNEATVLSRLKVYHSQTAPLVSFYEEQGILKIVNGDQPINKVAEEIMKSIKVK